MFIKYLKLTLRGLAKNKLISAINILGLAISLTAFIFISLYVQKELSYDTSHPNYQRIYRLTEIIESDNFVENSSSCPPNTGAMLLQDFPDAIENQVRFFDFQNPIVTIQLEDQRLFNERFVYFTDTSVFSMLDFTLVQGDPKEALKAPWTTVISEELAYKYFGNDNPIGKQITRVGFNNPFEITGIYRQEGISHIQTQMLHSFATVETFPFIQRQWVWNPVWTYIKLAPNVSVEDMEARFPDFIQKYYDPRSKDMITHKLMPIANVHLQSHLEFEMGPNSDIKYIYIFSTCALFLLIIAMVNFINLSTSHSLIRGKEIGVRKVTGATKSQIVLQFLIESVIIAFISAAISLIICYAVFLNLGDYLGLELSSLYNFEALGLLVLLVLIIGILSGVYPAFFISSFDPLVVLKGKMINQKSGQFLRKTLVIGQFAIAIVLIIFTYISYGQLTLLNNRDYGFDADKIIVLDVANTRIGQNYDAFRTELMKNGNIENVTFMSDILAVNNNNHEYNHDGMPLGTWNYYPALIVDEEFVDAFGMKVIAGRNYSVDYSREDSLSVLINKTMAKTLGYNDPSEALGKRLYSRNGQEKIVGVVEDFNYKSFHSPIGPFVLDVQRNRQNTNRGFFIRHMAVRVSHHNTAVLDHMETTWKQFITNVPFGYKSLDEELKQLYSKESDMGRILATFAILTVIIACSGLFALASFIAQQKTKEIGIRKVLGASLIQLFYVGYKEQFILILISIGIAIPVSYYFVDRWLSDFAYRTAITAAPFVLAGLLAIFISSLTVFSNFYKTIITNPANVLRDE